jgi:hypothetical protein
VARFEQQAVESKVALPRSKLTTGIPVDIDAVRSRQSRGPSTQARRALFRNHFRLGRDDPRGRVGANRP